ncbi:hypothetical protein FOXG_22387 [Fusarium oxysporum f. sp. lycopersici 4287]|uniref:Uncharacterized protein n=2 Tax=Fusarium oxysporum TaxID=5507 RepID=A0A0J9W7B3_FUSO4|nr:hypothetical protein FOXG_19439 [Fusarium oxysporum f. sp. lycopersici 4287]XP_018256718.1 hypothetical protein FOXG_22334 [Fusarium oxysporum f. sp. lycopersici 4287]XP_018256873.1 hypothetical protein FOXG_22387 [Fusarium oxysporum f. sp. lycopersici 4287]EXK24163.1 hypothetical protein FOMG_19093 [Fusarium oxysporum f. sp. melonis 26406]KNB04876.1 hypothetical protein FOXG_19439 [Fusarium oxysporum f. sp. lycopersici 4287]KNB18673.1 hypothetical protein FOXG_22334 [Fusarium oxysporum f. 
MMISREANGVLWCSCSQEAVRSQPAKGSFDPLGAAEV